MSMTLDNPTQLIDAKTFGSFLTRKLKLSLRFPDESPYTDQSFKADADINTIMARYQSTGEMPMINQSHPQFLDVTEADFQSHMNIVAEANSLFGQLPSALRARFGNDPGAFLGFVSEADNRNEMARLGLFTPEVTREILNPTPAPTPASSATE